MILVYYKKFSSIKKLLYALLIIVILAVIAYIKTSDCEGIECIYFTGRNDYQLEEVYEESKDNYRALYKRTQNKLRVEIQKNIEKGTSEQVINIKITNMKKIFEKERAPYPGAVSDTIECEEKFIPEWKEKNINGLNIMYTNAFLNERLVYGACTSEQIAYKSFLILFYCPDQKKLYNLEFISDTQNHASEDYPTSAETLNCQD